MTPHPIPIYGPLHWKAFATSSADVPRISIGRTSAPRSSIGIDMAYLESYFQTYTRTNLLPESTVRTHLKRLFEKLARTDKLTSSSSSLHTQARFLIV